MPATRGQDGRRPSPRPGWTLEIVKRSEPHVRRPAQAMDRRANVRLDQPQPPSGPRLRALRRTVAAFVRLAMIRIMLRGRQGVERGDSKFPDRLYAADGLELTQSHRRTAEERMVPENMEPEPEQPARPSRGNDRSRASSGSVRFRCVLAAAFLARRRPSPTASFHTTSDSTFMRDNWLSKSVFRLLRRPSGPLLPRLARMAVFAVLSAVARAGAAAGKPRMYSTGFSSGLYGGEVEQGRGSPACAFAAQLCQPAPSTLRTASPPRAR